MGVVCCGWYRWVGYVVDRVGGRCGWGMLWVGGMVVYVGGVCCG